MGIINNIKMYFKRAEFNKDFNANDTLMKYYGEEATINSILEIKKMSSKRFAETIDVSDQLLDKYKEKNDKDIQNELLKKYLKLSQDDLNKELLLEDEKITDEIDDTLKDQNLSEEEKKKIKEETLEEKRKGKLEGKDKEKELKTKLYEKAYNHLYKDYAYKVEKIKNAQFDSRSLALGTEEAMEIIAMEKGLEKVDLLYHNHTGRDISQIETIKAEKDSFERKMTYNENGIQNIANNNALKLYEKYKESMELVIAKSVPFDEYQRMMEGCDAIIDQLYSYTPSMNSLLAMSKGIICIGGGEPENYEIIDEHELRPIINVEPTYESVYHELEQLVLHPERIPALKQQSIEYVRRHHDYRKVAGQYLDFWNSI